MTETLHSRLCKLNDSIIKYDLQPLHDFTVHNNNIYLPVKAGCQKKSTSSTMLATLETNDNDYNNRKKTVQNKCPVYILYTN